MNLPSFDDFSKGERSGICTSVGQLLSHIFARSAVLPPKSSYKIGLLEQRWVSFVVSEFSTQGDVLGSITRMINKTFPVANPHAQKFTRSNFLLVVELLHEIPVGTIKTAPVAVELPDYKGLDKYKIIVYCILTSRNFPSFSLLYVHWKMFVKSYKNYIEPWYDFTIENMNDDNISLVVNERSIAIHSNEGNLIADMFNVVRQERMLIAMEDSTTGTRMVTMISELGELFIRENCNKIKEAAKPMYDKLTSYA
jgi:hypothetical protein